MSREGGFLGTLHYAAPEQAKGHRASAASDLYGLGVTVYECVAGRLPLGGETTEALLEAVLHGRPAPLRRVVPSASRDLEAVIAKLLAKEPADRYSDGEALARDLLRVADDEPVRIRRQPLVVLAWRQVRKHRLLASAIAVAAALLLTSSVLWWQAREQHHQRRLTQHANLLIAAVERAETQPGPAAGPAGVLRALGGLSAIDEGTPDEVLGTLEQAESMVPADPRTRALREAFSQDPLPEATAALLVGNGLAARAQLDVRIAESERRTGFAERDAVTWLRLYRLYLARAVASLTAAVADPDSASKDLLRASIVRPGAFAPSLLTVFVDWSPRLGAEALIEHLETVLSNAPPGAERVAGGLLRAFAGVRRSEQAHLMQFPMPYTMRRTFHVRAEAMLGTAESGVRDQTALAGSLEVELFDAALRATAAVDDAAVLTAALTDGRRRLDESVAPGSPLQSWRLVYALIQDPTAPVPELPDGSTLSLATQLRAWDSLLDLNPPVVVLRGMRARFELTLVANGDVDPSMRARLDARFAASVDPPAGALAKAQAWVELATDDPLAYLFRFAARVRTGDVVWASFDATRALQLAVDPGSVRRGVTGVLAQAEREDPALAAEWRRLRALFEEGGA